MFDFDNMLGIVFYERLRDATLDELKAFENAVSDMNDILPLLFAEDDGDFRSATTKEKETDRMRMAEDFINRQSVSAVAIYARSSTAQIKGVWNQYALHIDDEATSKKLSTAVSAKHNWQNFVVEDDGLDRERVVINFRHAKKLVFGSDTSCCFAMDQDEDSFDMPPQVHCDLSFSEVKAELQAQGRVLSEGHHPYLKKFLDLKQPRLNG